VGTIPHGQIGRGGKSAERTAVQLSLGGGKARQRSSKKKGRTEGLEKWGGKGTGGTFNEGIERSSFSVPSQWAAKSNKEKKKTRLVVKGTRAKRKW